MPVASAGPRIALALGVQVRVWRRSCRPGTYERVVSYHDGACDAQVKAAARAW